MTSPTTTKGARVVDLDDRDTDARAARRLLRLVNEARHPRQLRVAPHDRIAVDEVF